MKKTKTKKSELEPRSANESATETSHIVLPSHTNAVGTIFGGVLMSWIDINAAICAQKHARRIAVTASVDALYFLAPARVGDTVTLRAKVVYTGRTSMMVSVEVVAEDPLTGTPRRCVTAHLTFVAFDKSMRPTPVPPLLLKSKLERETFEWAAERRRILLQHFGKDKASGQHRPTDSNDMLK
jgi:acyl-CoA hydrolase